MSADADTPDAENVEGADESATPYTVLMDAINEAERLGVTPGRGRAAWVLDQYRERMPGTDQVVFGGPYSAGQYRCAECESEPTDHPGVRVLLPSEDSPAGGAVLAGPFCPGCAVRLLNEALR